MKKKLVKSLIALGLSTDFQIAGRISYSNITQPILYEKHKFFEYSLQANCLKEINKYLPTDLSQLDLEQIRRFVNSYRGSQEVKFVFYREDKNTRLYRITPADDNRTTPTTPSISQRNATYPIKKKTVEGFVITSSERDLKIDLIQNIGSISEINAILSTWETVKLHYGSKLDLEEEVIGNNKDVQLIFKVIEGKKYLAGLIVVDRIKDSQVSNKKIVRKKYFYIMHLGNKKLLIDENGYVIPGDVINVNKQIPLKNATKNLGSKYGYRIHPILRKKMFHSGQDIRAPMGTEIYSAGDGMVVFAGYNRNYGYVVVVYHGKNLNEGYSTLYAHCSKLLVQKGQKIRKGQVLGLVGSTGRSTGPHLHFEVINNHTKKRLNPLIAYALPAKMIPPFLIKNFLKTKQDVQSILKGN